MSGDDLEIVRRALQGAADYLNGRGTENFRITAVSAALSVLDDLNSCDACGGGRKVVVSCDGVAEATVPCPQCAEVQQAPATIAEPAPPVECSNCGHAVQPDWCFCANCGEPGPALPKMPGDPVECPIRKALQTARDTIQECFTKLVEIAEAEGRPCCDWDTYVAGAPEMIEIDAALSAPCSPCPECAAAWAEFRALSVRGGTALNGAIAERDSLRQKVERLEKALREIQWSSVALDPESDGDGTLYELCPMCDQSEVRGHSPDCLVGMALAEHEKDQKGGERS